MSENDDLNKKDLLVFIDNNNFIIATASKTF